MNDLGTSVENQLTIDMWVYFWTWNFILLTYDCSVLSHFSRVRLFATLWTVVHQAPLSLGFSRQEY